MTPPPDFLVIGAQKAGTTALYHFLAQHPQLFLPTLKEPHHFSHVGTAGTPSGPGRDATIVRDRDAYERLFARAATGQRRGEASPSYLYVPRAADAIRERVPYVRMIAVLRQPVDRAYSNYLHAMRNGREDAPSFEEALEHESQRIRDGWGPLWHYLAKGRYAEQIERYHARFDPEQLLILLYEDLQREPVVSVQRVFHHVGVDDTYVPDVAEVHNASRVPRGAVARTLARSYAALPGGLRERLLPPRLRHAVRDRVLARPERLDPAVRVHLTEAHFGDDLVRLEALLQRDLSAWHAAPGDDRG